MHASPGAYRQSVFAGARWGERAISLHGVVIAQRLTQVYNFPPFKQSELDANCMVTKQTNTA